MLWALLRLSVRDARSQLRYGRLPGPGPRQARRRPRHRGPPAAGPSVPPRSFRSGLTRSDGAGTGSRARPESESDLPHDSRSHWRYTQHLYPETCTTLAPRDTAGSPAPAGKDERPGADPGPFGLLDFRKDQKSMSPPPPGAAGAGFFSGFSAITASVVRNRPAIEAAFCSADRVTFAGSMMPALNMST